MRKATVLDALAVMRGLGYALAIVMAGFAAIMALLGLGVLPLSTAFVAPFVPGVVLGLVIAWTASLSRIFVQRTRFIDEQA